MLLDNQQLFGSALQFVIVEELGIDGSLTMTELIERICRKFSIENSEERQRLYDRSLTAVQNLVSMKKIQKVRVNDGKGNKRIKLCLASI